MGKRGLTLISSILMLFFYVFILLYSFFVVLNIDAIENYEISIVFEGIGIIVLIYFICGNILNKPIKTGYFVPLLIITITYTIILDVLNLFLITSLPYVWFVFMNMILLFIYCLVSIPMYVMGRKKSH